MKRTLAAIGVLLMLIATTANAEVRDDGGFFSADAVQRANTAIEQMRRDLGKEMLIETYPSIPAERQSQYSPQNKDAFFRKWGDERATAAHVNGVYILIDKNPAYLFVTEGNQTKQRDFTERDEHQLRDDMLALLKQKRYDDALDKAVQFVPQQIRANQQNRTANSGATQAPPPPPGRYSAPQKSPPSSGGSHIGGILVLLFIGFIVFMVIRRIFSGRRGYVPPTGGGYGYGPNYYGGAGGFGRGFLGGILGGMAGNWFQNRMSQHQNGGQYMPPPPSDPGGGFNDSTGDSSFTGGSGGSFDSGGGSDSGGGGDSGSSDGGSGGAF